MTKFTLPTRRELLISLAILALWLFVTVAFVGFRSEHILLCAAFLLLFIPYQGSRKLVVALLPFFIFGISYDWMNLLPNYEVNPVDVEGLYTTEKRLFGITVAEGTVLTPNEYFALHHCSAMDFMSGIFYLCWGATPHHLRNLALFQGRASGLSPLRDSLPIGESDRFCLLLYSPGSAAMVCGDAWYGGDPRHAGGGGRSRTI